jgi:DNA-binding transcriptional ArsR family regulator
MSNSKVDLIFHPVRARIIVEVSGTHVTAKSLAQAMPTIPRATLYRHINALVGGGILTVVEENQIRGTIERVYALNREAADLTPGELSDMSAQDYEEMFAVFVTSLLGDFSRYLEGREAGKIDLAAQGLRFGKAQLHLTDAEFNELQRQVYGALESVMGNEPTPNRKARIASVAFIPA